VTARGGQRRPDDLPLGGVLCAGGHAEGPMIVKNKKTAEDHAFWAHCEAVAAEVSLWPEWMRGEVKITAAVARKRR
jgi:hypothetical protein